MASHARRFGPGRMEDCMPNKNSKHEVVALFTFIVAAILLLSNGFVARISAQGKEPDVYQAIEPMGIVLTRSSPSTSAMPIWTGWWKVRARA
jgi:hypothetical protein